MKKILIVTSIKPDKLNRGGPSGLLWEIKEMLIIENEVDCIFIDLGNNFTKRFHQWGIFWGKSDADFSKYDFILAYPNFIVNYIPIKYSDRIICLCPDSTSFVFRRFYRNSNGIRKLQYYIYYKWFLYFEFMILKKVKKMIVVGRSDLKWLSYLKFESKDQKKIIFLRHPLLKSTLLSYIPNINVAKRNRRLVFSGDLSYRYVGQFMFQVIDCLNKQSKNIEELEKIDVIVVGKNNRWIYNSMNAVKFLNIKYYEWIEDYKDICRTGEDIHCIPLMAGAGTKNRVLTAIANGIEIISTPIGIESIIRETNDDSFIHIVKTPQAFSDLMLYLAFRNINKLDYEKVLKTRAKYREKVTNEFKYTINSIFS